MAGVAGEVDPAAGAGAGEDVGVALEVAGGVNEVEGAVAEEVDCVGEGGEGMPVPLR